LTAVDYTTIQQAQGLYRSMAQLATVEDHQDLRYAVLADYVSID